MTQSSKQIELQIKVLEKRFSEASISNKPVSQLFAINGKIKQLQTKLQSQKQFEFLAR